ncbi:MAG TPA: nitrate ABC transporter, permease protein, partial [Ramlibacter sp.]|nr:nitrate ABC transporter, permease protein [Ramlibacter sp.]
MVSAVFHNPRDAAAPRPVTERASRPQVARSSLPPVATVTPALSREGEKEKIQKPPFDWRAVWLRVLPPIFGMGFLVGIWALVSMTSTNNFPTPWETFKQAVDVFSDPFYSKGPNDQGVGWNVLSSLKRVAMGFGLAAIVGIPAGFMIGRFTFLSRMFNPLISLLRPVSPLAWLPIGLLV